MYKRQFGSSPKVVERVIEREIATATVSTSGEGGTGFVPVADVAAKVTPSVVGVQVVRSGRVVG